MRLTPTEEERLLVFTAAELARRTLQRGLQLSAPEAVALVCDEMHHAARGGAPFEAVAANGKAALAPDQVLPGVVNVVPEIRVEVLLDEGSRLIVIREPFGPADPDGPGAVRFAEGEVALVPDRRRIRLSVTSTSTRPIRISSHYPFWQANARLSFDREVATGFRLDLPAGDSLRWEPGETKEVELVAYGGEGGPAA